jgi:hypothetical protein
VIRVGFFVKDMAVLLVEAVVLVVGYFHYTVFHAECVAEIIFVVVSFDLYRPAFQILPVKQLLPFPVIGLLCMGSNHQDQKKAAGDYIFHINNISSKNKYSTLSLSSFAREGVFTLGENY